MRLWFDMLVADHGLVRAGFNTLTQVAPGIYRSSHPMPYQIRRAARLGIRTVINLRGNGHNQGAFLLEREACERNGIRLVQFRLRSRDLPSPEEVEGYAELIRSIDYPVLLHCKSGADRAGLASALMLMLRDGAPPCAAKSQLSLRFGHLRQAKTGMLDYFVERYAAAHDVCGISLLDWVRRDYDPAALRSRFRSQWWATQITDRIWRRE